jgi:hypothetical protein
MEIGQQIVRENGSKVATTNTLRLVADVYRQQGVNALFAGNYSVFV